MSPRAWRLRQECIECYTELFIFLGYNGWAARRRAAHIWENA